MLLISTSTVKSFQVLYIFDSPDQNDKQTKHPALYSRGVGPISNKHQMELRCETMINYEKISRIADAIQYLHKSKKKTF